MTWSMMMMASLLSGPGPGAPAVAPEQGLPSWHALEEAAHPGPPLLEGVEGADAGRTTSATVLGFLPYWAGYTWLEYDLISILACFCLDMGASGTITSWHGFPGAFATPIDGVHSAGGIAVITVCNFSSSAIHSILTTSRETAIASLMDVMDTCPVDGICIDFEGVAAADRDELTSFMQELRQELDIQHPGSHLSICTPAVDWSGAFDYDLLAETVDALMMMCYAFHGSWSAVAGPCCPLSGWGSGPESPTNMMWCLGDYVIHAPEVHEKLLVGLPYYGHEWETADQYPHSAVTGDCTTYLYTTLAQRAETYGRLWDEESFTPWYAYQSGSWNQGWYDDEVSLGLKYDIVLGSGMQGIGIWALGYDGSRPELWDAIEQRFTSPWPADGMTDNLENLCTLGGPSQYWHFHGTGQILSHFYTYSISSGPDVNWVRWEFDLPPNSGSYLLDAWIPSGSNADAVYRISHSGTVDTMVVHQSAFQEQWAPLGGPYPAASGLSVLLGDCTGTGGQRIGVDAVRFTQAAGAGDGGAGGPVLPLECSASPAASFTLVAGPLGEPGALRFFDCSGREVGMTPVPAGSPVPVVWPSDAACVQPGVYFAVLDCGTSGAAVERMVLLP